MPRGARRRYAYRECQGCDATVYQVIASADADGVLSIIRLPVRTLGGDDRELLPSARASASGQCRGVREGSTILAAEEASDQALNLDNFTYQPLPFSRLDVNCNLSIFPQITIPAFVEADYEKRHL